MYIKDPKVSHFIKYYEKNKKYIPTYSNFWLLQNIYCYLLKEYNRCLENRLFNSMNLSKYLKISTISQSSVGCYTMYTSTITLNVFKNKS